MQPKGRLAAKNAKDTKNKPEDLSQRRQGAKVGEKDVSLFADG
jgi:hypothetical protein